MMNSTRLKTLSSSLFWMALLWLTLGECVFAQSMSVIVSAETIKITFPQDVSMSLRRQEGMGVAGIESLVVSGRNILSRPTDSPLPMPVLEILSDDQVGGISDWPGYLLERQANGGDWPARGQRQEHILELGQTPYLGYRIESESVILRFQIDDGQETGELEWIFTPVAMNLGETGYQGLGWHVRLTGLEQAVMLFIVEPASARPGDWAFAQTWGKWVESKVGFGAPFRYDEGWYFGHMQPFYFAGGAAGASVSFFDQPVGANVWVEDDADGHLLGFRIPLGVGSVRETPVKYWLWSTETLPTKWAAVDEWTNVCDALSAQYRQPLGLGLTEPKPTYFWAWPGQEYFNRYIEQGLAGVGTFWFEKLMDDELAQAAATGIRVIFLQAPWESDADYSPERYLPGSYSGGSANAPWRLEVSEASGGEDLLKKMVARAHELGIKIVLWSSPGHLSNSSPLLIDHPEWIKWRADGVPEDFGYPDVTGVSQNSGYYDYAIGQYHNVHSNVPFDGIWQDSFLTFGFLPDARDRQPAPLLDRTLAMQTDFWQMGLTEVYIEGCGPLGLSTSGFGHEPPVPSDLDKIRGREYGLYRYVADVFVEPQSYYRALASKGVVGIPDMKEFNKLSQGDRASITQANQDYMRVLDKMQRRKLIAIGDSWQGVEWTNSGSSEVVLFAFERFTYPVMPGVTIKDITAGTTLQGTNNFETRPRHTYIIGDKITGLRKRSKFTYQLLQNYPNPFNPETKIRYQLAAAGEVELSIYNLLGQKVRTLVNLKQAAGAHRILWNGKNSSSDQVSSGFYFYKLKAGDVIRVKKMLLLR
ncbi:MAG: T9SS type A sorting domain-containing protein [bacterium]